MNRCAASKLNIPVLVGALTAAALAAATVESIPSANASCASFFGIGNSSQCTSNPTSIAIALGENAEAHADGILGAAFTLGGGSSASTSGLFNLAVGLNNPFASSPLNNSTSAGGVLSLAVAFDNENSSVVAGRGGWNSGDIGNVAVGWVVGGLNPGDATTSATGVGNLTENILGANSNVDGSGTGLVTVNVLGGYTNLTNRGWFNHITNIVSLNSTLTNDVGDGATGSWVFNVLGQDNTVQASGPLAIAGTAISDNQTVTQNGPGVNIRVGKGLASSARTAAPASVSAAALRAEPNAAASTSTGTKSDGAPSAGAGKKSDSAASASAGKKSDSRASTGGSKKPKTAKAGSRRSRG